MEKIKKLGLNTKERLKFTDVKLLGANDVIVIEQKDGTLTSTPFSVKFGKYGTGNTIENINRVDIEVNGKEITGIFMCLNENGDGYFLDQIKRYISNPTLNDIKYVRDDDTLEYKHEAIKTEPISFQLEPLNDDSISFDMNSIISTDSNESRKSKESAKSDTQPSLVSKRILGNMKQHSKTQVQLAKTSQQVLSSSQLGELNLQYGSNEIIYTITTIKNVKKSIKAHIYKWKYSDKIVISDIDGTVTKSDVRGQIYSIMGKDWSHEKIAELFNLIEMKGYKIVYLSARSVYQSDSTRKLLQNINQRNLTMPPGPLLLNPVNLRSAFHSEVIEKKPDEFKISCLANIKSLFELSGIKNPFHAGFGNKLTDVYSYKKIGIIDKLIFIVNQLGEISNNNPDFTSITYTNATTEYLNDDIIIDSDTYNTSYDNKANNPSNANISIPLNFKQSQKSQCTDESDDNFNESLSTKLSYSTLCDPKLANKFFPFFFQLENDS